MEEVTICEEVPREEVCSEEAAICLYRSLRASQALAFEPHFADTLIILGLDIIETWRTHGVSFGWETTFFLGKNRRASQFCGAIIAGLFDSR
jgi:hypothetical protein